MGYSLYITRRKNHWDEHDPRITEDEWKALVAADPDLDFKDAGACHPIPTWRFESPR